MKIGITVFFIGMAFIGRGLLAETTFLLVRHGQTDWNAAGRSQGWSDIPLNDVGRLQAKETAYKLYQEHPLVTAIYSSDLSRAYETAQATARLFGLGISKRQALREIDNGSGEGMVIQDKIRLYKSKWDELKDLYPNRKERWDHCAIEGEETLNALAFRIQSELEQIAASHPNQTVAVFSHSKAIRTFIADIRDVDITQVPPLGNADVRVVTFNEGIYTLQ